MRTVSETVKPHVKTAVFIGLNTSGAAGVAYLNAHPEEIGQAEGNTYKNGIVQGNNIVKQTPIIKDLPYFGPGNTYRVDYAIQQSNGTSTTVITITAVSQAAAQEALDWIKQSGYDPASLHIQTTIGPVAP